MTALTSLGPPRRLTFAATPALRRWQAAAIGLVAPLVLLLAWQHGARAGWIDPRTLPSPQDSWAALVELARSGELAADIAASLTRVAVGFAAGAAAGLALGSLMGISPRARDYVFPTFRALTYVPLLGWAPLAMLLVGIGEDFKFLLIAKAAFVPVTFNTVRGLSGVPRDYRELGAVYRLRRSQILRHVLLPSAVPSIWTGLRYGLTHAWLTLIVVELIAASEGLGLLIVNAQQLYQLDVVIAGIAVIGAIGLALDKSLAAIEARLLRWRPEAFR